VTYFGAARTSLDAKRLECVELAPAFGAATLDESASELDALQTLRVAAMPSPPYVGEFRAAHTQQGLSHLRNGSAGIMPAWAVRIVQAGNMPALPPQLIKAICLGVRSHSRAAQRPGFNDSVESLQRPPFFMTTVEVSLPNTNRLISPLR
jgi:hypothetical protein